MENYEGFLGTAKHKLTLRKLADRILSLLKFPTSKCTRLHQSTKRERTTEQQEPCSLTLFESSSILSDSLPIDMRISPCCCLVSAISTGTIASLAVGCGGGGGGAGGGGAEYGAVIICG